MTTKQQAEICVQRGLTDDEIVAMTGCHPECVEFVRAWGRGEKVEKMCIGGWRNLDVADFGCGVHSFSAAKHYRTAAARRPRLIRATAELPDGRTVEVEWPEPVREPLEKRDRYWLADRGGANNKLTWEGDSWDLQWLRQGRIYRTRESALQHDRAMIKLNGGEVE